MFVLPMKEPKDLKLVFNLSVKDREAIEQLAERWDLSLAGAIRRAIQEAIERIRRK